MTRDDFELVFSQLKIHLKEHKKLMVNYGFLFTIYRATTGNYSATSFREFIISAGATEILESKGKRNFIFNQEKFEEYLELKGQFKI